MKKWFYFIVPTIALVIFLFFYFSFEKQATQKAAARKAEIERVAAEDAARKAALEERARLDAEKKAKERAEAEATKEAERIARWNDAGKKIEDETKEAIQIGSDYTAKIVAYEKELSELRQKRENLNKDLIETARQVELGKVARRNAEMELQRMTEFLTKKTEESALANPPVVAAPAPAK